MFLSKLLSLMAGLALVSSMAFAGYAVTYTTNAFGYSDASTYVTFDTTTRTYGYTDYPTQAQYYYGGSYYYYPTAYTYAYPAYYVPVYYTYSYVTPAYAYPVGYRTGWYYN